MVYEYTKDMNFNYKDALVFFYAAYNSNCNINKDVINNLSKSFLDVVFIQVNTTKYYELKRVYDINKIPSYLYFKDNVLVSKMEGNVSSYTLRNFIESSKG